MKPEKKGGENVMKKITVIIAAVALAMVFAVIGCEKHEAPKPAEQSAPTATAPTSTTSSAPTATAPAAPAHK